MSRESVATDPVEIVRDYLSRGVTGSLHAVDPRGEWVLYVMQGEILAAHGPVDGPQTIRRLLNGGAISGTQADQLLAELRAGAPLEGLLLGRVPEDLYLDLLVQRFRQNVLEFISCASAPSWQPMEAVFVENIQTGHDSHELLEGLRQRRDRIQVLRRGASHLRVRPGTRLPAQLIHARLLDLCEPERGVQGVVDLSPFEDGVTLLALTDMLEQGVVELAATGGSPPPPEPLPAPEEPLLVPEEPLPAPEEPLLEPEDEAEGGPVSEEILDLVDLDAGLLQPLSDVDAEAAAQQALEDVINALPDEPATHSLPPPPWAEQAEDGGGPTLEPLPALDLEPDAATEEAPPELLPDAGLPASSATEVEDPGDLDDPGLAHAIRRAREIEARRAAVRNGIERDEEGIVTQPPGFAFDHSVPDEELAFFEDQDSVRGGGKGEFVTGDRFLDRVDLSDEGMAAVQRALQLPTDAGEDEGGMLAMGEASEEEARHAVALNFSGPRLDEGDIRRKIEVVNDVLAEISHAIDQQRGQGGGRVTTQILVDGPPTRFAVLFRGVQVDEDGRMDVERLLRNLRKRPEAEHRRLVNEGLLDLIQRALSTSVEDLADEQVDQMLERIAGYQQRLGL
ncbi:hypothetical protein L6R53_15905 [Myxococcota bacterium]|nr:hypothetical protein [Myxococcota bacterium]